MSSKKRQDERDRIILSFGIAGTSGMMMITMGEKNYIGFVIGFLLTAAQIYELSKINKQKTQKRRKTS